MSGGRTSTVVDNIGSAVQEFNSSPVAGCSNTVVDAENYIVETLDMTIDSDPDEVAEEIMNNNLVTEDDDENPFISVPKRRRLNQNVRIFAKLLLLYRVINLNV